MKSGETSAKRQAGFPALLTRLRHAAGLSQAELAERAGLSLPAVQKLEYGSRRNPSRDTLAALAEALGVTIDQMFTTEKKSKKKA